MIFLVVQLKYLCKVIGSYWFESFTQCLILNTCWLICLHNKKSCFVFVFAKYKFDFKTRHYHNITFKMERFLSLNTWT